jgi:DNA polymerase III subunit epsilon
MERHNFWVNRSFIVIDTETTGLDFENDRIIQLAVAVFLKGQNVWNFEWLFNTKYASTAEAVVVHGITDERRYAEGVDIAPVLQHCRALFRRMRDANSPLVAFNAPFDLTFLRAEFRRFKTGWIDEIHIIDPLVIDRHYEKNVPIFTKPYMRLGQMAARYGLQPPNHNALIDAIVTGHLTVAQTIHHSRIRTLSPRELHNTQQIWYDDWRKRVTTFLEKKKIEDWHMPAWPFGD